MSASSVWHQLHLGRPLDPEHALGVVRAWAADGRGHRVVLEARAQPTGVTYLIGHASSAQSSTLGPLRAQLPGTAIVKLETARSPIDRAVSLRASTRHRPLRIDEITAVIRALLGALSQVRSDELLVLQLLLGPRRVPMAVAGNVPSSTVGSIWQLVTIGKGNRLDAEPRNALRTKLGDHGFACTVRLGIRAAHTRRRSLLAGLVAALRTAETGGLQLHVRHEDVGRFNRAGAPPLRWTLRMNASEALALTAWPLGDEDLPGQPPLHPKQLPPVAGTDGAGRTFAVSASPGQQQPLGIRVKDAVHHSHIIGPTGSGKSHLIGRLIEADVAADRAVVVVEPKGDLIDDILSHVPESRRQDVVVLDPIDRAPIGLNPLSADGRRPELVADSVLAVFRQLYGEAIGPRSADILYAGLLTLARRPDASLVMLPLLLTNDGFRRSLTADIHDPIGLEPFWAQYNGWSDGERSAAIAPVMNKLRPLLRPTVRAVLGQREPRFSLRQVFTERRILLVPLRRALIGPEAAALLGSLVVSELWQATQARASVAASRRHPVMVYIDEVQDYLHLGTDLGDALAQARGFGVGFHLAHQYLSQLPHDMKAAILSNARSRIGFQLGHADAVELSKGHPELGPEDFTALGQYEIYASIFSRGRVTPYAFGRTVPATPAISKPDHLRALSRQQFGRTLDDIERGFADLLAQKDADLGPTGRRRRQP